MDNLSQLALRSQTIFGGVHFLFYLFSWPFLIGFLKDYHDKDRLTFNCEPKPSDYTRQRCYDCYVSTLSPLLTPLAFAGIAYGVLGLFLLSFILTGAWILRQIGREQNEQREKTPVEEVYDNIRLPRLYPACCSQCYNGTLLLLPDPQVSS